MFVAVLGVGVMSLERFGNCASFVNEFVLNTRMHLGSSLWGIGGTATAHSSHYFGALAGRQRRVAATTLGQWLRRATAASLGLQRRWQWLITCADPGGGGAGNYGMPLPQPPCGRGNRVGGGRGGGN